MKKNFTKKLLLGFVLISILGVGINIQPKRAYALFGVGDAGTTVIVVGNTSPTELMNTSNIWAERIKNYILDGLAWHIAKMIVQQITASVVQWINSGFQGSPSFVTNPGGFFADVGDQVTGNFIANTGILSGLCSPFNVDVRLSLALNQAGYNRPIRYSCTLNSVISNVGNSTINGNSIEGFMKGDFTQGGWNGLVELSMPANNEGGAYLQAQSDILEQIGSKQGQKQQQLLQGSGFLSWDSCSNISQENAAVAIADTGNNSYEKTFQEQQAGADAAAQIISTQGGVTEAQKYKYITGDGTSIQSTTDPKTGNMTYQDCHTETPGSVINSQLEKSLGSGVDQLNLADSINEIVDALMAQLVNQVLQTGLGAVTSRPSGITQSYIDQLSAQAYATTSISEDAQNIYKGLQPYLSNAQTLFDLRQQAVNYFNIAFTDYGLAETCYQNLLTSSASRFSLYTSSATINATLSSITSEVNQLKAAEQPYIDKLNQASTSLAYIQKQAQLSLTVGGPTSLQQASDALQSITETQSPILDTSAADSDAATAKSISNTYDSRAQNYLTQCEAMGGQ